MSSTSTNKQPALIDRPFLRGARITNSTPTCDPTNPNLTDLIQLVRVGDLPSEDAALVEDITIISNEDYPDNGGVRTADIGLYVYMPQRPLWSAGSKWVLAAPLLGIPWVFSCLRL
jgi:hypothetical protein